MFCFIVGKVEQLDGEQNMHSNDFRVSFNRSIDVSLIKFGSLELSSLSELVLSLLLSKLVCMHGSPFSDSKTFSASLSNMLYCRIMLKSIMFALKYLFSCYWCVFMLLICFHATDVFSCYWCVFSTSVFAMIHTLFLPDCFCNNFYDLHLVFEK